MRILLASLALLGAACSTEVVSTDTVAPSDSVATTTTSAPTGGPEVLLPRLVVTLRAVSEAIIDENDQRALLAEAESLWSASKPAVEADDSDAAAEMEGMMDLARGAVERSRPADADKAAKFLDLLVDHYLAT